jgi:hypothetical protein
LAAMRAAFESMLAEFEPVRPELEFDRQRRQGGGPGIGAGWEAGIRTPIPWSREQCRHSPRLRSASVCSSLSTTTSVGFGLFRCAPAQVVSMCLTRLGSQPASLSGHGFKPALRLAFQSC